VEPTVFQLVAIDFKGGVAIAEAGRARVWLPGQAAMALGALIPLWTYPRLRFGGKLSAVDATARPRHVGALLLSTRASQHAVDQTPSPRVSPGSDKKRPPAKDYSGKTLLVQLVFGFISRWHKRPA